MDENEMFPWEDIEASMRKGKSMDPGGFERDLYKAELVSMQEKAVAEGAPETVEWIYFSSPQWTWENLCGREGWLLIDRKSKRSFDFLTTVMN